MEKRQDDSSMQRKNFLLAGLVVGALLSAWYLYSLHGQKAAGMATDSIGAQCLNVPLIFVASIFQFSLLHKGFVLVMNFLRRKKQG